MQIIGITGTLGAGKGTIVHYLVEKYNFCHYSVRDYLIQEIERRNLPRDRDSMVAVANDLRKKYGPSYIIDELHKKATLQGMNTVIESIRTPGEVASLREKENFILLAVNADPKIRYERILDRNSETDHVSFDVFMENEKREMETTDPTKQNLSECIKQADFILSNDGDFEELYRQVDQIMKELN